MDCQWEGMKTAEHSHSVKLQVQAWKVLQVLEGHRPQGVSWWSCVPWCGRSYTQQVSSQLGTVGEP